MTEPVDKNSPSLEEGMPLNPSEALVLAEIQRDLAVANLQNGYPQLISPSVDHGAPSPYWREGVSQASPASSLAE